MLLAVIIGCEIGFWVFLGAGLTSRYIFRWKRLGAALLICVPLVDLVLLGATVLDLRAGTVANFSHGLAAAYLGFSITFGHSLIKWADERFAYRFAGGPPPTQPPSHGLAYAWYEWKLWFQAVVAYAITCVLLLAAIYFVNVPEQTGELTAWFPFLTVSLGVWLLFGPLWYTLFQKKPPQRENPSDS